MSVHDRLAALGMAVPELLLPNLADLSKWAVIACDQFTQDRAYWEALRFVVRGVPSTLNLIYPEAYLEDSGRTQRIASIHQTMGRYLAEDVFSPPRRTLMYIERQLSGGQVRRGILAALDLECYDWKPGTAPMIRPTEGTVAERILPRMEIRRGAALESPHILILLDDEENNLIPALGARAKEKMRRSGGRYAYDTDLIEGAGRVTGWFLDEEADWESLAGGLEALNRTVKANSFLYAVGDGNHSLATAKAVWEEYRQNHRDDPAVMDHPARWALVEIENLYDPALVFEPIHRAVFGASLADMEAMLAALPGFRSGKLTGAAELAERTADEDCGALRFGLVSGGECSLVEAEPVPLAVDVFQPLLDDFTAGRPGITVDYIHGTEEVFRLAGQGVAGRRPVTGILLPPFRKQGLFSTVAKRGPLPRKSFSMGNAEDKRFYLECRKLFD